MSFLERGTFFAPTQRDDDLQQAVILTKEEAAAARQLLAKLLAVQHEPAREVLAAPAREPDVQAVARAVYQSRKKRAEHFGAALFSEPAWDMLLVLFLYEDRGDKMSVTRLAEFSEAPLTTAIRWLDYLESQRLIERSQCSADRRKFYVSLSDKGRSLLLTYFESLIDAGEATGRN